MAAIEPSPQRKRFRDDDMLVHTIPIPKELNDLIAVIIGPAGHTVKSICSETGVKRIEITKDTDPRTAVIKGPTQEAVNAAAGVINAILYDKNERERIRQQQLMQRNSSHHSPSSGSSVSGLGLGMGMGMPPPQQQQPVQHYDPTAAAAAAAAVGQQQYYGAPSHLDVTAPSLGAHPPLDPSLQQLYGGTSSNDFMVQQLNTNVNAMLSVLNDISTRLGRLEARVEMVEKLALPGMATGAPAPATNAGLAGLTALGVGGTGGASPLGALAGMTLPGMGALQQVPHTALPK